MEEPVENNDFHLNHGEKEILKGGIKSQKCNQCDYASSRAGHDRFFSANFLLGDKGLCRRLFISTLRAKIPPKYTRGDRARPRKILRPVLFLCLPKETRGTNTQIASLDTMWSGQANVAPALFFSLVIKGRDFL